MSRRLEREQQPSGRPPEPIPPDELQRMVDNLRRLLQESLLRPWPPEGSPRAALSGQRSGSTARAPPTEAVTTKASTPCPQRSCAHRTPHGLQRWELDVELARVGRTPKGFQSRICG